MVKPEKGALSCLGVRSGDGGLTDARTRRPVWLISFGDLLTLLWCMMLSLICYGHFQPVQPTQALPQDQRVVAHAWQGDDASGVGRELGTALADQGRQRRQAAGEAQEAVIGASIFLTEGEFGKADTLSGDAETRLYALLAAEGGSRGTVTVETCASGGAEESWAASISRALMIRSRLVNAGLSRARLRLRAAGSHCETLRAAKGAHQDTAAWVRVTLPEEGSV